MVADYYSILEVDPRAERATLEAALNKAQPFWSAGTRNPKNKHKFQSYLDQIPAIRQALLGDPTDRLAYDAELAATRRAERDRTLDALHHKIRLRASKGGLTVSDRTLLRAEADRVGVTLDELNRLLEPYPPMPETPDQVDSPDPPADVLDATSRRQIRIALEHLRRKDLYDVLGLPRDAPSRELVARADAERQKWMQKAAVTAEKTAWLEAVSYAQSHLAQADTRARYDRTLIEEAEQSLRESITFALERTASVSGSTRQFLREEAAALGILPDRADRLIDRACREMGVARDGASSPIRAVGLVRYLRCRSCSGLTEYALASRSSDSAVCRHCRASLRWSCPVCRRSRWVDETRCACGFPLEHVEPLVRYFEAAQHAHRIRDYAEAIANLRRVQDFAPRHIGARKGIEKIKEKLAEIDQARASYQAERSRRNLIGARARLSAWGRLVDPTTPELVQGFAEVTEGIRQAMALSAKAHAIEAKDPHGARTLYRQALFLAADLPEARDGLRLCPPEAPTELLATIASDRVRLRWTAPAPDGLGPCTYMIRRKRGGVPDHSEDGIEVGEATRTEFEDETVTPGDSVGYGVFSVRGEVASLACAVAGPVPILADVMDLRIEAGSHEVELSWVAPPNCAEVVVLRKLGNAPLNPEDGTLVASLSGRAIDRGLKDDRVYHYGVFALYRANSGRLVSSRGMFASAMPTAPVSTVVVPTLSRVVGSPLRISWTVPERGQVHVFRSMRPFPHLPGDRIDRSSRDGLVGTWLPRSADDHALDRNPPARTVLHYTAMIAWGSHWTVGRSVEYASIPDPSGLSALRMDKAGRVVLRWDWPEGTIRTIVVCRIDAWPEGPSDPSGVISSVEKADYAKVGSFALTLPTTQPGSWHVATYGVVVLEGREVESAGVDPDSRTTVRGPSSEVSVSYDLKPPGLLRRSWSVILRTDPPGATVPPLALVTHPRSVPLTVDDGEIVATFPGSRDGTTFSIDGKVVISRDHSRLFADPKADLVGLPPIVLRHPEAVPTRV